jgi:hypothetical protein
MRERQAETMLGFCMVEVKGVGEVGEVGDGSRAADLATSPVVSPGAGNQGLTAVPSAATRRR